MNIYTVRDNLKNTIAGKEKMLAGIKDPDDLFNMEARMVAIATRQFLSINIDELSKILADVEKCCEQHNEMGWTLNPERMGQ